jgi:hypothetical protein
VPWTVGSVIMIAKTEVSGRRDWNPRLSAWEADVLPLNYSRVSAVMAIAGLYVQRAEKREFAE